MSAPSEEIKRIMEEHHVVGLAAAVLKPGGDVWTGGYGWANLANRIPVTEKTVFRVASISKTVVATALMQQVEQGRAALDQEAGELLGFTVRNPKHPDKPVTLKHLLTHTSGLQDEYVRFVIDSRTENPPKLHLRELIEPEGAYYSEGLWGDGEPGDPHFFEYSNTGAILLATIIEKLSNERFDLYCRNHIFDPLGMADSSFNIQDIPDMDAVAVLYEYVEDERRFTVGTDDFGGHKPNATDFSDYVPGTNGAIFSPQGGLRTTVKDLSRFMRTHAEGGALEGTRILQQETAKLMHNTHWSGNRHEGFFRTIGLQFMITEDLIPGKRLIGHSGDAYGLLSNMYFHPEEQWGILLIMNGLHQKKDASVFFKAESELAGLLYNTFLK
ncbi:hypothetical protein SY83_01865 [Paenibacillus swuensis]|uniref:Beta-lactamase-related domain-containing protein n=1 Tax=Paenibacillus swuensis TaxID=1178515 RepID=A0A172TEA3_9BACL|nr:serine hydrolase domain-containing protein [Paenibacillus swuensis]ANE45282.1 hypothetical protein SY83_01865 [Paenibacillus swuensis]